MKNHRSRLDMPRVKIGCDAGYDDSYALGMQRMYRKTLAYWALDILTQSPQTTTVQWQEPDPMADPHNRHWAALYIGSILDD